MALIGVFILAIVITIVCAVIGIAACVLMGVIVIPFLIAYILGVSYIQYRLSQKQHKLWYGVIVLHAAMSIVIAVKLAVFTGDALISTVASGLVFMISALALVSFCVVLYGIHRIVLYKKSKNDYPKTY